MSILGIIGIIVLLIIVVGVIVVLSSHSSSSIQSQSQLPEFQNLSGNVPAAFSGILSQSGQGATQTIAAVSTNHLSNTTEFSVSYKGILDVQPSGALGAVASISSPLYINESKYSNSTKLTFNSTSIPIIGSARLVYAALANGTYTCTNFNTSAVSSGNYGQILSNSNRSIGCVKSSTIAGINIANIAKFNLSSLSDLGITLTYTKDYQSSYKGMGCTYIAGNMVQLASNGTSTGTGQFGACISDTYYMPLSLAVTFSSKVGSVFVNLNETSIGNYSNSSFVNSLPGPVVK